MRVAILGATGMLGSMLVDVLSRDSDLAIIATAQSAHQLEAGRARIPTASWKLLQISSQPASAQLEALGPVDWYVNAIGLTKPYIHDDNFDEVRNALIVNASWPMSLAEFAGAQNARILQIGTDCVFSGAHGNYRETDPHDALDVYGKTKSLGEAAHAAMSIVRTSILGPEPKDNAFLLAWLLGQPTGATVNGFTNHRWNGVATLQFARVAHGLIKEGLRLPPVHHLVPADSVTKAELLECFKTHYNRSDITVKAVDAKAEINRTLSTANQELNQQLWALAGYGSPPSIDRMIAELAQFPYRFLPTP